MRNKILYFLCNDSLDISASKFSFSDFSENNTQDTIGSDESGTGDVFGPPVVCSAFVKQQNISFLKQMKVKDSKKKSDSSIRNIVPLILDKIPHVVKIVSLLDQYNILIQKNNANKIKALFHNLAILELVKKVQAPFKVVLDQFASPQNYFNYLKEEKKIYKSLIFETKAENKYISVAVASMIARYFFLQEIDKLNRQMNLVLKLGASVAVDEQLAYIKLHYSPNIFQQIAKCNFRNVQTYLKIKK